MKTSFLIIVVLLFDSCFYFGKKQYEDVTALSPNTWSTRDCITIIMGATRDNLLDTRSPNIKVVATAYTPSVIMAVNRRAAILGRYHQPIPFSEVPPIEPTEVTEKDYRPTIDLLLQEENGLYYDWEKEKYVDARGNYVQEYTQIDSLTFLLVIHNVGWPAYLPDITHLEDQIFLVNDQNKFITPLQVWGKRRNKLTIIEENLIMKFQLRKDDYHFLQNSQRMYLVITGFDEKITLEFPASIIQ